MTSMQDKHSQCLYLMAGHKNIYTTNQAINQKSLIRMHLFHPSIHLISVANLSLLFQFDVDY